MKRTEQANEKPDRQLARPCAHQHSRRQRVRASGSCRSGRSSRPPTIRWPGRQRTGPYRTRQSAPPAEATTTRGGLNGSRVLPHDLRQQVPRAVSRSPDHEPATITSILFSSDGGVHASSTTSRPPEFRRRRHDVAPNGPGRRRRPLMLVDRSGSTLQSARSTRRASPHDARGDRRRRNSHDRSGTGIRRARSATDASQGLFVQFVPIWRVVNVPQAGACAITHRRGTRRLVRSSVAISQVQGQRDRAPP